MAKKAVAKKAAKKGPKTQRSKASVAEFLAAVGDERRRADAKAIDRIMREVSGERPAMWGPSIVGYGTWRAGEAAAEWPKIAFSPRKGAMVLYIEPGLLAGDPLMKRLGKHRHGKSCLYINRLDEVDRGVLRELVQRSWDGVTRKYG